MIRIILFLLLIAFAGWGAAWVADQPGEVVMNWGGWRAHPTVPVFVMLLGITIVAAILVWTILLALLTTLSDSIRTTRKAKLAQRMGRRKTMERAMQMMLRRNNCKRSLTTMWKSRSQKIGDRARRNVKRHRSGTK